MSLESSHGNEGRAWKFTKQIATKALFRGDPVTPSFQALLKVLSQAVPETNGEFAHENRPKWTQKEMDCLPTVEFQGRKMLVLGTIYLNHPAFFHF